MSNCRFCDIIDGKVLDYKVWEDELFIALLDINPAKEGHLMLIPKKHVEDIFDLDDSLYQRLFSTAKRLSGPLKIATNAKRIGLVVVGFAVPHAHLHLVPLHKSNELFDPSLFKRAEPEELRTMQKKISEEIDKSREI